MFKSSNMDIILVSHNVQWAQSNIYLPWLIVSSDKKEAVARGDDGGARSGGQVLLLHRDAGAQAGLQEVRQPLLLLRYRWVEVVVVELYM